MSPALDVLADRRAKARKREDEYTGLVKAERLDIKEIEEFLESERKDRDEALNRRQTLAENLEAEIERDEAGKGKKGEHYESWVEARRDELADLVEASEARIDRLIERSIESKDDLRKFLATRDYWQKRLKRLENKIERKRTDKPGQLSAHFHVVEFGCRDGTPVPQHSIVALKSACENYLEPLREEHGLVSINSGFRTRTYNIRIGGASMSVHVYDAPWQHDPWAVAIDHICGGLSPSGVQAFHERVTHPDGMGRYSVFTHVDNRNRIGWGDSRWAGP